jgi:integration host factor subunit alpha
MLKKNFTRKDLSNKMSKIIGFSKNLSSRLIDDFFEILVSEIIKSNKVKISAFGTFHVINKKKRIGRNPKTKIPATISSRKVVKFKPSKIFKDKLNEKNL